MKKYFLLFAISLFFFLPKDTFALTIANAVPNSITYYNSIQNDSVTGKVSTYNIINTYYYGYSFSAYKTISGISFNYPIIDLLDNKLGNVSGVLYTNLSNSDFISPFRIYIKDYYNNISSCKVEQSRNYFTVGTNYDNLHSRFNTFTCENAFISGNFSVYVVDTFNSEGTIAVSNLTFSSVDNNGVISSIQQNTEQQKKTTEAVKEQTEATKKQTETIKDSDTSGSKDSASGFFSDFESDDYGLSDIITMPLDFIKGLANSSCSSLHLPLPLVDKTVELPCMTSIYSQFFGPFLTLYQTITTGLIGYWCCVNILKLVQGFKNPDNDEVEVMDL